MSKLQFEKIPDFMIDGRFNSVVLRDYEELSHLDPLVHSKSVLVLSGSVIEGVLTDAILAATELTLSKVNSMSFEKIIETANEVGVIKETNLSTVLRGYRNLVHPAREVLDHVEFSDADATLARAAVDVVFQEVARWSEYFKVLSSASTEELDFLNLFQQESPQNSPFDHNWLKSGVYQSSSSLEAKKLIIFEPEVDKFGAVTRKVSLNNRAVRYVEALVFKKAAARRVLILHLRNIESNLTPGSGATGSM